MPRTAERYREPRQVTPSRRVDRVVLLLLGIASLLLCLNLNSGYLWEDEAETALLARNTLHVGYPRAVDGRNTIEITTHGYGPGEAWIYNPWLCFYLVAGVFRLVGESTWSARLPFALFGLLSLYLTWRLIRLLTRDVAIQRLSVALLTFSVPFLLHMRQCRYYAVTTAGLLLVILAFLRFEQRPSLARASLVGLSLAVLFHTNFGTFVPALAAVGLHQLWRPRATSWRWSLAALTIVGVLTLPWVGFFYRSAFVGTVSAQRLVHHLEYYVRVTNKYFLPLACILLVSVVMWLIDRRQFGLTFWRAMAPSARRFLLLVVAAQVVFLVVVPDQRHLRYLLPVLPLLAMMEAGWLMECQRRHRVLGGLLILLALWTNALQSVHANIPMADFCYELTHRYTGPMEGIVAYLREHARPDDVVKIPYDDRTLMFYTSLRIERPSEFLRDTQPDWIVLRHGWTPDAFFQGEAFRRIEASYERIELDAPDVYWQNREDPGEHHFRTVTDAPRVVLYHKRHG